MPDVQVQTRNSVVHVSGSFSCWQPPIHGREVGQNSQEHKLVKVWLYRFQYSLWNCHIIVSNCKWLVIFHQASNQDNDHNETNMFLTTRWRHEKVVLRVFYLHLLDTSKFKRGRWANGSKTDASLMSSQHMLCSWRWRWNLAQEATTAVSFRMLCTTCY